MKGRWGLDGLRTRPQAILWADNFGTIDEATTVNPLTSASTSFQLLVPQGDEYQNFIILSDHNRSEISFQQERIENRKRMINGNMRSYHVADKLRISWSWDMLPSRAFNKDALFDETTGKPTVPDLKDYTVDGGAGGVEIVKWYTEHPGSFWMLLAYDRYDQFDGPQKYGYMSQYNQMMEVYFSDFNYDVVKRGGNTHDFWNISVTVEEV